MIQLKILPVNLKLVFSEKNPFFRFGPFPGHALAYEISTSATCWPWKCAPCPQKTNILANLNLSKMQKTSLAIGKVMFFIEKVTCPPVEKSCISQAAPLVFFHFGPIPSLGYIGATFPRAISTSENTFFLQNR